MFGRHGGILINAPDETGYKYMILTEKLWTQKIVPNADAFFSLNRSLINTNSNIVNVFERPITKNYALPTGENNLLFDNIFDGIIPHKLYLSFLRLSAVNGAYFSHCKVSSVQLQLNGNNVTSLNATFPKQIASMFHHTLVNNGNSGQNLLSQKIFKDGRTILVWDLRPPDSSDTIPLERSSNLRLTIKHRFQILKIA